MNDRHQSLSTAVPTLGLHGHRPLRPRTGTVAHDAVDRLVAASTGGTGGAGQPPSPPPVPPSTTDPRGRRPSVLPRTLAHPAMPGHARPGVRREPARLDPDLLLRVLAGLRGLP